MFNPFLLIFTFLGVGARINEYIPSPSVDIESYQINHTSDIKLPQSFTWSNVDGVNYLTKKSKSAYTSILWFMLGTWKYKLAIRQNKNYAQGRMARY